MTLGWLVKPGGTVRRPSLGRPGGGAPSEAGANSGAFSGRVDRLENASRWLIWAASAIATAVATPPATSIT